MEPKMIPANLPDGSYIISTPVSIIKFTVKDKQINPDKLPTTFIRKPNYWLQHAVKVDDAA